MKVKIIYNLEETEKRRRDGGSLVKTKEDVRGSEIGRKMRGTERVEIALNAVDLSELNQRRPAVSSDSALPLNITGSEMN